MSEVMDRAAIYVDGAWVDSTGTGRIEVVDPATEEAIAVVAAGTADDVDRAAAAARSAFPYWSARSGAERGRYLWAAHDVLLSRRREFAELVSREMGMPVDAADEIQIGMPLAHLAAFAELAQTYPFDEGTVDAMSIVKEPIGVVGAITPWNYPLHQVVLKIGAALAAGCTVVIKPSEVAPLAVCAFVEILHEVGVPPGVVNLVSGLGPVVGEAISGHPEIDMISFTGSTTAGKRVAVTAAGTVKKVALELGGKSAFVILDDADLERAVPFGVARCLRNSGQTCSALTRMLVPEAMIEAAARIAVAQARSHPTGDPADPDTVLGPLVSAAQRDSVLRHIDAGLEDGATLALDGRGVVHGTGYFVGATVFSDVTADMTIAREEIFGPVLVIMGYRDEEEAVRLANDTDYGLAAAVWSGDPLRAEAVARRLRAGQVFVNGAVPSARAPFGGYKQSGIGREGGVYGLEEFLEIKAILR
ncbi:aldehyde dehydrogenase family protein [Rhodococcus sp. NPDC127528]|uniref:aldehyde dehydrogenase family protein n=1 Tax=unclassified Rhodococcus (in: high G+C Gram-positive bacteria) TaxID=192944 RepID=UPI003636CF07